MCGGRILTEDSQSLAESKNAKKPNWPRQIQSKRYKVDTQSNHGEKAKSQENLLETGILKTEPSSHRGYAHPFKSPFKPQRSCKALKLSEIPKLPNDHFADHNQAPQKYSSL